MNERKVLCWTNLLAEWNTKKHITKPPFTTTPYSDVVYYLKGVYCRVLRLVYNAALAVY